MRTLTFARQSSCRPSQPPHPASGARDSFTYPAVQPHCEWRIHLSDGEVASAKQLVTLDSLHAGELEETDALQEQAERWCEIEATVPSRSLTVPGDCASSPIIALPTSAMTILTFLVVFRTVPEIQASTAVVA